MKKLTEVGTGIVTVTQMLTLLGNSQCFEKKPESHLRQRVRGVIWQTVIIKRRWLITSEIKTEKKKLEQVTYNLGDFAIGAGGVLWVLGSMFKKEGTEL